MDQTKQHANSISLQGVTRLFVKQIHEWGELLGFETRNKYVVLDESQQPLGYAAEQQKGYFGFLMRQFLGHWRSFDVHFFNSNRQEFLIAHHPFRFLFQRIEIRDLDGNYLGALQQKFAIINKRFNVENAVGLTIMEIASPLWTPWTFNFLHQHQKIAQVKKKWSGLMSEAFTDRDNFMVSFDSSSLSHIEKNLILVSAVFIDLIYFERKSSWLDWA